VADVKQAIAAAVEREDYAAAAELKTSLEDFMAAETHAEIKRAIAVAVEREDYVAAAELKRSLDTMPARAQDATPAVAPQLAAAPTAVPKLAAAPAAEPPSDRFATGRAKAKWLADVGATLRAHFGLDQEMKTSDVLTVALEKLVGASAQDLSLVEKADACLAALGSGVGMVAAPPPATASASTSAATVHAAAVPSAKGEMETGVVVSWNEKGFGFISPDRGGDDVFCHAKSMKDASEPLPCKAARVSYRHTFDQHAGKARAEEVTVLEGGGGTADCDQDGGWYAEQQRASPHELELMYRKRWRTGCEISASGRKRLTP